MSDTDFVTLPEEIRSRLAAALEALDDVELPSGFAPRVMATADPKFGDYQSNAAMMLASCGSIVIGTTAAMKAARSI